MRKSVLRFLALIIAIVLFSVTDAVADEMFEYEGEAIGVASTGTFAPYYVASNRHGIVTQKNDVLLRGAVAKRLTTESRFSWGFGVEAVTGYTSSADYARYDSETSMFVNNPCRPAVIWLSQLYGEVKYRGVFLTVGMKQHESALLNFELSSGDLVESGNARAIPEVRAGFIDFQNIPFTNGWLQIQGEIAYGKFADNDWLKHHYNYYNWHINLGGLYTYSRAYFRTNPSQPLSFTFGMQKAGMFGGTTTDYRNGVLTRTTKCRQNFSTFLKMMLPTREKGSAYYDGNSLGSWDVVGRYRFGNGAELKAYVQKPWEDGSGIGWMNGFDGVWGLEYRAAKRGVVSGVVVEYLDFTNQSGPIHWSPGDNPGTDISAGATGGDQYYNNYQSNSYMNFGMSIGTPFLPSPIYNLDGYPAFVNNRVRGFHVGINGTISSDIDYRFLAGYRKGWGDSRIPTADAVDDTSMLLEACYRIRKVAGLSVKAQVAFDAGSIYGDCFGAAVSVVYNGKFSF